jgi:hypothetical protein
VNTHVRIMSSKRSHKRCSKCHQLQSKVVNHEKICLGNVAANLQHRTSHLKKGVNQSSRTSGRNVRLPAIVKRVNHLEPGDEKMMVHKPFLFVGLTGQRNLLKSQQVSNGEVLNQLRNLLPREQKITMKTFQSPPEIVEILSGTANAPLGSDMFNIHDLNFNLPDHAYLYADVHDVKRMELAKEVANIPVSLRDSMLPEHFSLVVSTGNVLLTSHQDVSCGILVLGEGSNAIGEIMFADNLMFTPNLNTFAAADPRCTWTSVATLTTPHDFVSTPTRHPHTVRWSGARIAVSYYF